MNKDFDCVEMKRQGAEHARALTQGTTREQVLEFWRKRTEEMRERQRESRGQGVKKSA